MCITAEENAPRDISEDVCAHSAEANPSLDQFMTDKICQPQQQDQLAKSTVI